MPSLIHSLLTRVPRPWVDQLAKASRRVPLLHRVRGSIVASLKDRDGVVASGPSRGLRFNPGQSDSRFLLGTFEPALQELFVNCLRPGDTCYDVGANVGFFSILAAREVGPAGYVHCFEPLPANADQISHNAKLNGFEQITVHQVALSDVDSMTSFRISSVPTFGALSDAPMSVDQQIGEIQVRVRRLDDLVKEAGLPGPHLVKADIEGSEVSFLAGAEETIRRHRPLLLIELHGTNDGVASFLERASYTADVVGGGGILEAPWAALIVGTPNEAQEARAKVQKICHSFSGR